MQQGQRTGNQTMKNHICVMCDAPVESELDAYMDCRAYACAMAGMPMITRLPTLYKKTATGAIQLWEISVASNTITTTWGQLGGAMQTATDVITRGKNIGRSNATTPEEQALAEAKARHEKQRKKGYVAELQAAQRGELDEVIKGGVLPMLASTWEKRKDKIEYPVFVQPKLDGHRCVAIFDSLGKVTLWTRTRKPITGLPHIVAALEKTGWVEHMFDGELYSHSLSFEQMTSYIRTPEAKEGHEAIQYHVYDLIDGDTSQDLRFMSVGRLFLHLDPEGPIVPVPTHKAGSEDKVMSLFASFLEDGYEGAMVRSVNGRYENKRSKNLVKVKEFNSSEFEVVDVRAGRGIMADKAIFVCKVGDTTFDCKMRGTLDSLKKYLANPELAIGKLLEVQYQELTEAGIPRFPVGIRLRKDLE